MTGYPKGAANHVLHANAWFHAPAWFGECPRPGFLFPCQHDGGNDPQLGATWPGPDGWWGFDCNVFFRRWRDDPRVEYLIWNRRIWSKRLGERPYKGGNPHDKHIHVSIKRDGVAHLNTKTWFYWVLGKPTRRAKIKAALQRPKKKV